MNPTTNPPKDLKTIRDERVAEFVLMRKFQVARGYSEGFNTATDIVFYRIVEYIRSMRTARATMIANELVENKPRILK